MIQQIKIKNFLSFRDETVFNFEASNDNFAEDSQVIKMKDGTRLLRFAIIYGYNASGKSNLVESFDFLSSFWVRKPDSSESGTRITPFAFCKTSQKEHSVFEMIFYADETKYWYQLELDEKNIFLEKLSYYKTTQPVMLFERTIDNEKSKIKFNNQALKLSPSAREFIELNCLKNTSVFVARDQVNVDIPLIDNAKNWLRKNIFETVGPKTGLTTYATNKIKDNSPLVKYLLDFLSEADFNISDVATKSKKEKLPDEVLKAIGDDESIPEELKSKIIKDGAIEKTETLFSHLVLNGRKNEKYLMQENRESMGTMRTFGLESVIYEVVKRQGFLPIDEIETSLHSKLLEMMLFNFLKEPSKSQIIATTHNDGLLDLIDDLIRKDSIWFVEKQKNGVSDLYKLTDFKGLNRLSSIRAAYRNKRFGATQFSV